MTAAYTSIAQEIDEIMVVNYNNSEKNNLPAGYDIPATWGHILNAGDDQVYGPAILDGDGEFQDFDMIAMCVSTSYVRRYTMARANRFQACSRFLYS